MVITMNDQCWGCCGKRTMFLPFKSMTARSSATVDRRCPAHMPGRLCPIQLQVRTSLSLYDANLEYSFIALRNDSKLDPSYGPLHLERCTVRGKPVNGFD